jgi:hypothetical protein
LEEGPIPGLGLAFELLPKKDCYKFTSS